MGEDIDGRADQYSLAATAYHLLTGSQLFPHSNPAVVISRHLNSPPPALAETRPELAALDPGLSAALAKDPDNRFARCAEFAQALAEPEGAGPPRFAPHDAVPHAEMAVRAWNGPLSSTTSTSADSQFHQALAVAGRRRLGLCPRGSHGLQPSPPRRRRSCRSCTYWDLPTGRMPASQGVGR